MTVPVTWMLRAFPIYTGTRMHAHTHTNTCVRTHTHKHTKTHAHKHIHAHTHAHIYTREYEWIRIAHRNISVGEVTANKQSIMHEEYASYLSVGMTQDRRTRPTESLVWISAKLSPQPSDREAKTESLAIRWSDFTRYSKSVSVSFCLSSAICPLLTSGSASQSDEVTFSQSVTDSLLVGWLSHHHSQRGALQEEASSQWNKGDTNFGCVSNRILSPSDASLPRGEANEHCLPAGMGPPIAF